MGNWMEKRMQKTQGASGMVKATMQDASKGNGSAKVEKGKDLRQNASGGAKAKGSM
jgi:hypothetical protein